MDHMLSNDFGQLKDKLFQDWKLSMPFAIVTCRYVSSIANVIPS
jgi:hypothetical protein